MAFGNLNTELHEEGYEIVSSEHIPEWRNRGFKKKAYDAKVQLTFGTINS